MIKIGRKNLFFLVSALIIVSTNMIWTNMEYNAQGKSGRDYYDVYIVWEGLSGAVIAEQYASQIGQNSLVIDKHDHIGGSC